MSETPDEQPLETSAPDVVLGDAPQMAGSPWLIDDPAAESDPGPKQLEVEAPVDAPTEPEQDGDAS